ncbi:MAG: SPOR domain-containing protein [Azoarcus sp.]|nr:SPOR domain-containing protein [Azoarcus sp.]
MSDFIDFTVSDAELEIKKRARRRLLGATSLALLAVVVLSFSLMNSEEPRAVPDMQVSVPGRAEPELAQAGHEAGSESADVVIEPDAASASETVSETAESSVVDTPLPEPSSPPLALVQPEEPAPNPTAVRPTEEPRQKPKPSRPSATQKEDAEDTVLALLEGKSPATGPGKEAGQVFIQVAAFKNADRAAKQVRELKKQGFPAYTEKAGKVTRVRIGPLARTEGEQVMARLETHGHKAVLSSR